MGSSEDRRGRGRSRRLSIGCFPRRKNGQDNPGSIILKIVGSRRLQLDHDAGERFRAGLPFHHLHGFDAVAVPAQRSGRFTRESTRQFKHNPVGTRRRRNLGIPQRSAQGYFDANARGIARHIELLNADELTAGLRARSCAKNAQNSDMCKEPQEPTPDAERKTQYAQSLPSRLRHSCGIGNSSRCCRHSRLHRDGRHRCSISYDSWCTGIRCSRWDWCGRWRTRRSHSRD